MKIIRSLNIKNILYQNFIARLIITFYILFIRIYYFTRINKEYIVYVSCCGKVFVIKLYKRKTS